MFHAFHTDLNQTDYLHSPPPVGGCVKSKNQVFFDILYKKDFISLL